MYASLFKVGTGRELRSRGARGAGAKWDSPTFRGPRLREYAQPFESHAESAQALSSPPPTLQIKKPPCGGFLIYNLAEAVGFEPTIQV